MLTTARAFRISVLTVLLTGCFGAEDSTPREDYDAVRVLLAQTVADGIGLDDPTVLSFNGSDDEIECVAAGVGLTVSQLQAELDGQNRTMVDEETNARIFRCFSDRSIRAIFDDALTATGGTTDEFDAVKIDRECVLDSVVETFADWRATQEPFTALHGRVAEATESGVADCTTVELVPG